MTCIEKLKIEHPEAIIDTYVGCIGCPNKYGYAEDPDWCQYGSESVCKKCWDREIPEGPKIKDSGERRQFGTGAVRDIQEGKGRCDLLPLDVVAHTLSNPTFSYINKFTLTGDTRFLYDALTSCGIYHDAYTMFLEVAKHFEAGAKKYSENNWKLGINTKHYIDSGVRHYLKYLRGDKDEPHDRAFCWNIMCCIWTCSNKLELNDYQKGDTE